MPAFDPVRDAVLNSPITQSQTLPNYSQQDGYMDRSLELPSPSTSRPSSSHATSSPSLTRRATDLAVLLNSEPHEERTPSSVRRSSLSHLLSGDTETEKLNTAPSLQRRLPPAIDIPREDQSFSRQHL